MTAEFEIRDLEQPDSARWDKFVSNTPGSTFFHLSGWKSVIEKSLGHSCHYLYASTSGSVRGVLPLVHVKSRLFGNCMISNGFCVYGGPLAENDSVRRGLEDAALERAKALGVDYLEFRLQEPRRKDWAANDQLYVAFRKAIDSNPEKCLAAVPRKQRAMIRKGIARGLRSEIDEGIDHFYPLYSESVRNLGTPVMPRNYFRCLKETFGEACEVRTVYAGNDRVSSVMTFYHGEEVHPYYGGGGVAARGLAANDFMYWEVMRHAAVAGYKIFNFGRSKKGTGSYSFKKHWGFSAEPLCYEYKLLRQDEMPSVNPTNPKYALMIAVWKRLPLFVANLIGPPIARQLG